MEKGLKERSSEETSEEYRLSVQARDAGGLDLSSESQEETRQNQEILKR